jgi:hypothetical protein
VSKPKEKVYRKIVFKSDPKICLTMPKEILNDLEEWAKKNARTKSQEVVARVAATLEQNETFMAKDRLIRLIMSEKLAYKSKADKGSK